MVILDVFSYHATATGDLFQPAPSLATYMVSILVLHSFTDQGGEMNRL